MNPVPQAIDIGPYDVTDFLRFAAAYWDFGIGGHYDRAWAEARGFEAPYAQGYLLWATTLVWAQHWAEDRPEAVKSISIRFSEPIYVGDKFRLEAQPGDGAGGFEFTWTEAGGRVKATGSIALAPRERH